MQNWWLHTSEISSGVRWTRMGYLRRNIVINLRIISSATQKLGIDAHICELQLGLRQMAEIQVIKGPARLSYLSIFELSKRFSASSCFGSVNFITRTIWYYATVEERHQYPNWSTIVVLCFWILLGTSFVASWTIIEVIEGTRSKWQLRVQPFTNQRRNC